MFDGAVIDVLEDDIEKTDRSLLAILLTDRTTRKNILWGTDDYSTLGEDYGADKEIHIELITSAKSKVIQLRVLKAQAKQQGRTRDKAEVFTPLLGVQRAEQPDGRSVVCWIGIGMIAMSALFSLAGINGRTQRVK